MKKIFFLFFWNELKSSFWFVPVLIIIISIFAAFGLIIVDYSIEIPKEGIFRHLFVTNSDSARSILSTISGAMIGVAGTVFSVTLVALTLASSQFGSRLIKNFMNVRLNQVVLGTYISSYAYCLVVLSAVRDIEGIDFVPSLSILLAIIAAILNIILLIVFIHQISVNLQADKVISDISDLIEDQIEKLFPEKVEGGISKDEADVEIYRSGYENQFLLKSQNHGYLQYVDHENLFKIAKEHDCLIELFYKPGEYLVQDCVMGKLHYTNIDGYDLDRIYENFVIGKVRTAQQDVGFSIHQMVEIASRALSPGVNDPFTAIACVDNLSFALVALGKVNFPSKYRFDNHDNLRMVNIVLTYEDILDDAFNQIRQFSKDNVAVSLRLMETLVTIHSHCEKQERKQAVRKHANLVLEAAKEHVEQEYDFKAMEKRYSELA